MGVRTILSDIEISWPREGEPARGIDPPLYWQGCFGFISLYPPPVREFNEIISARLSKNARILFLVVIHSYKEYCSWPDLIAEEDAIVKLFIVIVVVRY